MDDHSQSEETGHALSVDDPNCFGQMLHPRAFPKRPKRNVGDMIAYLTRDHAWARDSQEFRSDSIPADLATVDLGLVHPMISGPVHITGSSGGMRLKPRSLISSRTNMDIR